MTDRRSTRWTPLVLAVGAVALVAGLVVLLLPYSTTFAMPDPDASLVPAGVELVVPCKAPLVDAVTADSGGWVNYAPDGSEAAAQATGGRADGELCSPESVQRVAIGGAVAGVGALLLLIGVARLRRERRVSDEPEPSEPDEPAGEADPEVSPAPA